MGKEKKIDVIKGFDMKKTLDVLGKVGDIFDKQKMSLAEVDFVLNFLVHAQLEIKVRMMLKETLESESYKRNDFLGNWKPSYL